MHIKRSLLTVLLSFFASIVWAQTWTTSQLAPMPMPISNNAVVEGNVNGVPHVFSFSGIDSTKIWSGLSLKSFRYNTVTDVWDTIAPLPDPMGGKIAAGASNVKNKIYIIGGYHVLQNGNEISSDKVHIYDPDSNIYKADGSPLPLAIDDHVQAVWRDSLIFVVTGWSNTSNRPNVQIYDPALDTWLAGTSVPNNNVYKSFGASGLIIGDTLYYYGGASMAGAFNIQNSFRKGAIDPTDPTQIVWSNPKNFTGVPGYRVASTFDSQGDIHWIGGSSTTYNYNGIAYNGSGGVAPSKRNLYVPIGCVNCYATSTVDVPMDLRGIANIKNSFPPERIIAGGMIDNQQVTDQTLLLSYAPLPGIQETRSITYKPELFPNPVSDRLSLKDKYLRNFNWEIFDLRSALVISGELDSDAQINVTHLDEGIYFIRFRSADEIFSYKFVKIEK